MTQQPAQDYLAPAQLQTWEPLDIVIQQVQANLSIHKVSQATLQVMLLQDFQLDLQPLVILAIVLQHWVQPVQQLLV